MPTVRFIHVTDTHVGPTADFELYGIKTAERVQRFVDYVNRRSAGIDFVVHTGDVVADPDQQSYTLAASLLSQLNVPLYLVNGNHDDASLLEEEFDWPTVQKLSSEHVGLAYEFAGSGERFVVLDARGPDGIDPAGLLPGWQLDALSELLELHVAAPFTLFVHFPALPLDCDWLDRRMLIQNGWELHQLLRHHAHHVRGVFFGHVHRGTQTTRDGVLYCSAPSAFAQFQNWPGDAQMFGSPSTHTFFNLVTIDVDQVVIRQMWCESERRISES